MIPLSLDHIEALSEDRPLVTPEIHKSNDFYGHAVLLKKFLNIHPSYPLKVAIEHGPTLSEYVWDVDQNSLCPVFLCANNLVQKFFTQRCNPLRRAVSIGPLIYYLEPEQSRPEKEIVAERTLLVFPNHSTHHTHSNFDLRHHLRIIAERGKQFDRVLICVYWKDVLKGLHQVYYAEGFDCTTAGHMYDPEFLYRLRAIIGQASSVLTFACGTSILYSILHGKPAWIAQDKDLSFSTQETYFEKLQEKITSSNNSMLVQLRNYFSEPSDTLSAGQVDFVRKATGFYNLKRREELMRIIEEAEVRFCALRNIRPSPIPRIDAASTQQHHGLEDQKAHELGNLPSQSSLSEVISLMDQAVQALQADDVPSAFDAVIKAGAIKTDIKGLDCLRAICFLRVNKIDAAKDSLEKELLAFPDNTMARNLLSRING